MGTQTHPGESPLQVFVHRIKEELSLLISLVRGTVGVGRDLEWSLVFEQAGRLFSGASLFFVVSVMASVGGILVLLACDQAMRLLGDFSMVGPGMLQLFIREFGPTIVALMLCARYGAEVASEIAAMKISEQIDALKILGADPMAYLVAPRVWGSIIASIPLAVLGVLVAFFGGYLAAYSVFDIGPQTFLRHEWVGGFDVACGLTKSLCYGAAIPLVASHAGLHARGGAPGVGRATTRAVIGSSLAVLAIDMVVGTLFYLLQELF